MIAALSKSKMKQDKAVSACQTDYRDSGATVHVVMDDSCMEKKSSSSSFKTAGGKDDKTRSRGT